MELERGRLAWAACAVAVVLSVAPALGQDTAGMKSRPGRRPIQLWPPAGDKEISGPVGKPITIEGWTYRAVKSSDPRGSVPWELVVTPAGENAKIWHKGSEGPKTQRAGPSSSRSFPRGSRRKGFEIIVHRGRGPEKKPDAIPVVEIPDGVWKQWMAPDLQDVVGIHFHEFVTDDMARILYSIHKVPPDGPDGKPPAAGSYPGRSGSRVEATLLAPVTFCLDQAVVVRKDPLRKERVESRARHELAHAGLSQEIFLEVFRGPQDWNLAYCTGRRSQVSYYWKREKVGRGWDGYRSGVEGVATLRTSVVLVPPTRWSMLLPIPPERVTQKHIQALNDAVVFPQFDQADREAQRRFHAEHGSFEASSGS